MNKFILILFLISAVYLTSYSQCNGVLINSETESYTINSNNLVPCLNTARFSVTIKNITPFPMVNIQVGINLPDGINYVPSSVSNATENNIVDIGNPILDLNDLGEKNSATDQVTFYIDLVATCALQDYLDNGGLIKNIVTVSNDFSGVDTIRSFQSWTVTFCQLQRAGVIRLKTGDKYIYQPAEFDDENKIITIPQPRPQVQYPLNRTAKNFFHHWYLLMLLWSLLLTKGSLCSH